MPKKKRTANVVTASRKAGKKRMTNRLANNPIKGMNKGKNSKPLPKLTGTNKKLNTATSKTTQQKNTKLTKAADRTRKSSAVASVGTSQPAKMSPVKKTTAKVNQRKASSFDKALKLKKKPGRREVARPRRTTRVRRKKRGK